MTPKQLVLEEYPYAECWHMRTSPEYIVTLDVHDPKPDQQFKGATAKQAWEMALDAIDDRALDKK